MENVTILKHSVVSQSMSQVMDSTMDLILQSDSVIIIGVTKQDGAYKIDSRFWQVPKGHTIAILEAAIDSVEKSNSLT